MTAKRFIILFLLALSFATNAQQAQPEMADAMRANGKIYVVVGIILVVLTGFIVYLIMLDRKLGKIEKQLKK
jgi:multisubunit Na+/H+ antiporter MnhB subunit